MTQVKGKICYHGRMSITTKTGDDGTTGLFNGARIPKNHPRMTLIGILDELNAQMGIIRSLGGDEIFPKKSLPGQKSLPQLEQRQNEIFELSALIANPGNPKDANTYLEDLEKDATAIEQSLPQLTHFILPGGHPIAAQMHLARTVCRRAERVSVLLNSTQEPLPFAAIPYLNRLSDYLFNAARKVNQHMGAKETLWYNPSNL